MRKSYKVFLAFLLVFTMLTSMGVSGFAEFTEEEPTEENIIENQEDIEEPEEAGENDLEEPKEAAEEPEEMDEDDTEEPEADQDDLEETEEEPKESEEDLEGREEGDSEESEEEDTEEDKAEDIKLTNLTVNHILIKEDEEEEIISTEVMEDLPVDKVITNETLKLNNDELILLDDPLEETIISEGENILNLYYKEKVEKIELEKTKLVITHILIKENGEEIISINSIENIKKDTIVFKKELKLKDDDLIYLENSPEEYTVLEGLNEINLYYERKPEEIVIEYTDLTINHILTFEYQADDVMTETIEDLEVGTTVYSSDYIVNYEGIEFVRSEDEEILLTKGSNTINLYYELEVEDEYIAENPDFALGEGVSGGSTYIQEFSKGSLGPFADKTNFSLRSFEVMGGPSYPDAVNNKTWPEPGSLKLNKTGEAIEGSGNQWEITLEIEGKDSAETSDIVLVIDRSGSMKGQRIIDARNAAKDFVNTLLNDPNKTNTRIAIVSFASNYQYANEVDIDANFTDSSGKQALLTAIDGIVAHGGTHIQAGIRQANALLNGSTADYQNIVLLGDGAATYSYRPNNPNNYLEFWRRQSSRDYYRTTSNIPESGFNYNVTVGNGASEYTQYASGGSTWSGTAYSNNYRHGAHAIAEAGFGKAKGYEFYSIALDAGPEGDWTLEEIASPGNYYQTPTSSNLNIIFQEIAGRLSSAATDSVVTDPLGDMYDILGINASNYNDFITVSHGTVSYDTTTDTITWNIGTISEGTNYWMKYTVALDYSAEGGVFYPANKPTYIDYINIDNEVAKKYFPIPEFRLRALTLTKLLTNGSSDQEFDIIVEGPVGPYSKTWAVSLKDGESKTIKGLLPGSYSIKEIVPMNYEIVSISDITIGEDDWVLSSTVTNKKSNDGWFHDDDELINSFNVGVVDSDSASIPSNRKLYTKLDFFLIPSFEEQDYKYKG